MQRKSYSHFFSKKKKNQHICVSLDVNFNGSLTNDVVSFEQLGPRVYMGLFCLNKGLLALTFDKIASFDITDDYQTLASVEYTCIQKGFDL